MHRDLKPENLVFKKINQPIAKNSLKLIDFGLAEFARKEKFLFEKCGTPGYIAPEIFQSGKKYGTNCDVFSLGVIFYQLMVGEMPFGEDEVDQIIQRNEEVNYDKIHFQFIEEEFGSEAIDLLERMLKKNPTERITIESVIAHPFLNSKIRTHNLSVTDKSQINRKRKISINKNNLLDEISLLSYMENGRIGEFEQNMVALRMRSNSVNLFNLNTKIEGSIFEFKSHNSMNKLIADSDLSASFGENELNLDQPEYINKKRVEKKLATNRFQLQTEISTCSNFDFDANSMTERSKNEINSLDKYNISPKKKNFS